MLPIFDELWRVLRKDGTCWVVIGDKYVGKCLALLPGRFGEAMVARGWLCRNKCIWHKPNVIPSTHDGQVRRGLRGGVLFHESQALPLPAAVRPLQGSTNGASASSYATGKGSTGRGTRTTRARAAWRCWNGWPTKLVRAGKVGPFDAQAAGERRGRAAPRPQGANMRSVWTIPVGRCKEAHFATYPRNWSRSPSWPDVRRTGSSSIRSRGRDSNDTAAT